MVQRTRELDDCALHPVAALRYSAKYLVISGE
jgi:hypothetical protein